MGSVNFSFSPIRPDIIFKNDHELCEAIKLAMANISDRHIKIFAHTSKMARRGVKIKLDKKPRPQGHVYFDNRMNQISFSEYRVLLLFLLSLQHSIQSTGQRTVIIQ